ncbi:MAG: bifunctional riboflavin kinase/FAD synthetase [Candidatus Marinimicrobia bacterium]|nr:bifunctional riboflavin kinase/FAD synthetase [Candidatus Neomarinimicrobiota bacterium]MCF7880628.1 bifunctional riboflavin kinase/FAD synthetase [Candidatus Neomarinimicrobiota bacterium]
MVTIGSFDGMHYGHKQLIFQVQERSKALHVPSILITFQPHPKEVLLRDKEIPVELLTTTEEKKEILNNEFTIDHTVILPFTLEFSQVRALEFLEDYIIQPFSPSEMVVGYDHSFGKDREGDASFLRAHESEYGYTTHVVEEVRLSNDVTVSSSRIRSLLRDGKTLEAAHHLTRPYQVTGNVEHGEQRGQEIGFPTANIAISNEHKLLPEDGVYLVYVTGNDISSYGMCNIGYRPTFDEKQHTLEVHLLDAPTDSLYGRTLTIHFFHRLRQEQEFESVQDLIDQIEQDKQRSQAIITNENPWVQFQEEKITWL